MMTTHDEQVARYTEPWRPPNAETDEPPAIVALEHRIDALREQVNFAIKALKLSEAELNAIADSLSGRT